MTFKHRPLENRLRLHGMIARSLGIMIVSGRYQPGDVLDSEITASGDLEVSRTAYREGVRILAAKGLVESRPKAGTRVSPRDRWHMLDPDILSWIFENEPDEDLVVSLFELRRIVEPEAAALAARRRSEAHLERMAEGLKGMQRHSLATQLGRQADQEFHTALLAASNNPFLVSLTSGVTAAVDWTTVFKQRRTSLPRDPVPDHILVYEAVADSDPEAAHAAMTRLVDMALQDTISAVERTQPRSQAG